MKKAPQHENSRPAIDGEIAKYYCRVFRAMGAVLFDEFSNPINTVRCARGANSARMPAASATAWRNSREKFPARRELAGTFLGNGPLPRVNRRENICKISNLPDQALNSPRNGAGNYFARAGN